MAESAKWEAAIKRIKSSVVTIHFARPRSWDSEEVGSSYGTGFVVDAQLGYILTNCHIVGDGPFTGYCVFYTSHEECEVKAIYRDPVHDFGFLRFDPKAVRYTTLKEAELRPDLAQVGCEVRIIGNDGKKKGNSILSGHISDLDSPGYLNSYFIQSAMFTSGGSSGSPVFNAEGQVIALHSSAGVGATRYHVPLDGPLETLDCIRQKKPVSRGTIFSEFVLQTFDSCRRLGLSDDWERELRNHSLEGTGLLTVQKVLPECPVDAELRVSDILIKMNDAFVLKLKEFNQILNENVGKKIKLLVQRNGSEVEFETEVQDLHSGTPNCFVEIAGAVLHSLTYRQAHKRFRALRGVYLAQSSVNFNIAYGCIIKAINDEATPTIEEFIRIMKKYPDIARLEIKYESHANPDITERKVIDLNQRWVGPMSMAVRDDEAGIWHYKILAHAAPATLPPPQSGLIRKIENTMYPIVNEVFKSFVRIHCQQAVPLVGFAPWTGDFFGLVVDADQGLVVASRAWILSDMCSLQVQIADTIRVPAEVLFLHPLANFVVIKYYADLVKSDVKTSQLSHETIKKGDSYLFLGLTAQYEVVLKASVLDIRPFRIITKFEGLEAEPASVHTFSDGVLLDEDGTIRALWLASLSGSGFSGLGLSSSVLVDSISQLRRGLLPEPRVLGVEVDAVDLAEAPPAGIPEEYLHEIKETTKRQLIEVKEVDCVAQPNVKDQTLRHGDFILKINGKLASWRSDVETTFERKELDLVILRDGIVKDLSTPTILGSDLLVRHVLLTFGGYLQQPPPDARQSLTALPSYIYVSGRLLGSPCDLYGLSTAKFIVSINERPVSTLTDVRNEIRRIPDDTYFRLGVVGLDRSPGVLPMKKNEHYFPTVEFIKQDGSWRRIEVGSAGCENGQWLGEGLPDRGLPHDISSDSSPEVISFESSECSQDSQEP